MLSHLLVCLPLFFPVQGDRVETKSGEVLKGKVVTMGGGKLEFASDSMGKVTIPFADLKDLMTEKEIKVVLKDGTERKYRFVEGDDDLTFAAIKGLNPKEPDPLSGDVSMGFARSRGNTDRLSFSLQARAVYDMDNSRFTNVFEWLYGQDKDPATSENYISQRRVSWDSQVDYFFTKRAYSYGRGTALGDKESAIDYRYTLGAGMGYAVIKSGDHTINGELGVAERWERKTNQPSGETFNLRIAANGSHKPMAQGKLDWDIEYVPSVQDSGVYLINFNIAFVLKLWGDLVSTITYSVNYDNTPALGNKRTDQRFIWGLGFSF